MRVGAGGRPPPRRSRDAGRPRRGLVRCMPLSSPRPRSLGPGFGVRTEPRAVGDRPSAQERRRCRAGGRRRAASAQRHEPAVAGRDAQRVRRRARARGRARSGAGPGSARAARMRSGSPCQQRVRAGLGAKARTRRASALGRLVPVEPRLLALELRRERRARGVLVLPASAVSAWRSARAPPRSRRRRAPRGVRSSSPQLSRSRDRDLAHQRDGPRVHLALDAHHGDAGRRRRPRGSRARSARRRASAAAGSRGR